MARLMTAEQVADEYGLPSPSTLRTMRARGLPAIRLGRAFLFDKADVDTFIAGAKETACPAQIEVRRSNGSPSVVSSTSSGSSPAESGPALLARRTAERLKGSSRISSGSVSASNDAVAPPGRSA